MDEGTRPTGAPTQRADAKSGVADLLLFDAMPQLGWAARPDGFIDYYNRGWYEYTGTTYADMEGWGWQSVHDPDELPRVMSSWTGCIAAGQPFETVFPLRRKDGVFRWFLTRATPIFDGAGKLVRWVGINTDIDDERRAKEAVERSEEASARLAAIVESSDDAIIGKTLDGVVTSSNRGAERLFGYSAGEMVGASMERLIPAGRVGEEAQLLARLRQGETVDHFETVRVRKDGSEVDVSISISPILDRAGHVVGAAKIARDISGRKRAEEAMRQLNEDLERRVVERTAQLTAANHELSAFSYSVAHDLRAPLRGMNGFARILLDDYSDKLDAGGQDCLREIHSNAAKMGQLIDGLLALSRLMRSDLKPQRLDLTNLARTVVSDLAAETANRTVDVVIAPGLQAFVDPTLARALLENLLANALKFTRRVSAARVELGTRDENGERVFFVRDNGAGFDMAYVDKLFAPFQRLHSAAEYEGTGVGLATVQRIIHRHGGRIWTEGRVNGGATFYFTLPEPRRQDSR